ncbi:PREDICTED: mimitin, mitochondrial-like [Amphimedon queenslandica]|uniref:NADH dehydrogenase [ubiquinone] 1 alpha subcomplex subunit 12 n=1 Tax=Amphimedon queenslandica TaxID=400682 RepID=A0A1X7UFD2_AMPQE|nr:PREDICTED: mimitin, mitochondrial-like [Amphimedon queenslandica]|eukprot:XP_019854495.1 PREDICTED: mimitin, mitochondrial-like [Amphimedon queenslandica]
MLRWLKDILRPLGRSHVELKGTDLNGNRYFEKITPSGRVRRSVESSVSNHKHFKYTQDSIPPEWDRWLRGLTDTPPTVKDQLRRLAEIELMKKKVKELETAKDDVAGALEQGTESDGHASSRSFRGPAETSDVPLRSGKDFTPSSWKPND